MPLDGERLRALRLARGFSERQLGRMIGESGNVIGRLERGHGHARLTLGRLARIAQSLGVHPSALLADDQADHSRAAAADDARIEAALLRSTVLLSVAELGRGLQLDRDRIRSALDRLEERLAGTGARLHRAPTGYAIVPREELLRASDVARLERARIDRRALDKRTLTVLYTIFARAGALGFVQRLGEADRVALGRLLNARLVERRGSAYRVSDDLRFGLSRGQPRREPPTSSA